MNIDSPFEQWRLKYMRGTAASKDIMELLALAFEGGRAVSKPWVSLTDEEINDFDKKLRDNGDYCSLHFAWGISAKLKEKNNAI